MKSIRNVFLIILLCWGCASHKPLFDVVRKQPHFSIVPPGTVWLKDSLFIDETEISNINWREFLYYINHYHNHYRKSYCDSMLPDTMVWYKRYGNAGWPFTLYYFRHPAYCDYPIVGISYYQAEQFCKWRTDRVNQFIAVTRKLMQWSDSVDTTWYPPYVIYGLPTKAEWEYAASAGLDACKYPYGYESLTDKDNLEVSLTAESVNMYLPLVCDSLDSLHTAVWYECPDPVFAGKPNKFGIYNLLGNVSEIIADSLYKGLNYTTYLVNRSANGIDSVYNNAATWRYTKPECWLGFRCVCRVLRK